MGKISKYATSNNYWYKMADNWYLRNEKRVYKQNILVIMVENGKDKEVPRNTIGLIRNDTDDGRTKTATKIIGVSLVFTFKLCIYL